MVLEFPAEMTLGFLYDSELKLLDLRIPAFGKKCGESSELKGLADRLVRCFLAQMDSQELSSPKHILPLVAQSRDWKLVGVQVRQPFAET